MRLVLSLLLTLPAVLPISQDRKGASPASDRAVVEAIWRDVVVKRMTADYRADAQESEQLRAQLLSETLVVCDTRRRPCISPPVVEIARLSAAAAKWSPVLSSDLARLTQPLRLTGIDVQGVTLADRREALQAKSYHVAVSAPVYFGNEALVYLQCGKPMNTSSWLVLLRRSPAMTWAAVLEVATSIGDF